MRDILVAGNWKMNGDLAGNAELVAGIVAGQPDSKRVKLLVCPPFPYLASTAAAIGDASVALGAPSGRGVSSSAPSMASRPSASIPA